ncbi:MAG: elongation factor P [Alphaproteobacteria bacterium]
MKINANLIKVGNILKHKDKALQVLNTNVIKPGKGGAFIQVEMKDIQSGVKFNERWRTSDTVEKISVHEKEVTFLYIENEIITFMNNENFEQITCPSNLISGKEKLLKDGMKLSLEIIEDKIANVVFPKNIKVKIEKADAVVKGQTASSSFKNALTTSNLKLLVPSHIKEGDYILISSENLNYVEKAKD